VVAMWATQVMRSQDETQNRDITVLILRASAYEGGKCQSHRETRVSSRGHFEKSDQKPSIVLTCAL
jgi:hypothetical protein